MRRKAQLHGSLEPFCIYFLHKFGLMEYEQICPAIAPVFGYFGVMAATVLSSKYILVVKWS
jgi:hypothetical protein